jgi:hypothetical protein
MKQTNKRWRRVKRGKYGRVSILYQWFRTRKPLWYDLGWKVEYWYLDGMRKTKVFNEGHLGEALDSQRRFLAGGKP